MIIKWKTGSYGIKIERMECARETDKTLIVMTEFWGKTTERKALKDGSNKYHDSWEAARDFLIARCKTKIENYKRMLNDARTELGNVESMKAPDIN